MKALVLALSLLISSSCALTTLPAEGLSHRIDLAKASGVLLSTWLVPGASHAWALGPLVDYAHAKGYSVTFMDLDSLNLAGGMSKLTHRIVIDNTMSTNMQVSSLAHEIAHDFAFNDVGDADADYYTREVFAEYVAFFVCDAIDLNTSRESYSYLSNYPQLLRRGVGDRYAREIHQAAKNIATFVLAQKKQPDSVHGN